MKEKLNNNKIYAIYTALFILIVCIVFGIFFVNKRTFIWQADGLRQHYIILKDFNEIVRNFLASPQKGMRLFSWNMGLGLDVIGQYSYYILGDPFAYISLLFPMENLETAYSFLVLLRLFCIGISFIVYAKYNSKVNYKENKESSEMNILPLRKTKSILLGAIIYTFSAFSLFAGVRHPYFLNAMILFPLLLLGVEKLLKENKKVFLCTFVAISAISNYYFFYMHTIMIVIYAIIKYFCEYRKEGLKYFLQKLSSGIIIYIIGILIASIILFPTIYAFLNSARSGEENVCEYTLDYYKSLFSINLLTVYGENWSVIGVSSIILVMLPIFLSRIKQNKTYFIYLCVTTIFLVVPFLGSAMNGFSFPNNRWSFVYAFILSYIITICFDEKYSKKEIRNAYIFLALYALTAVIAILSTSLKAAFIIYLIQILLAFIMLVAIYIRNFANIEEKATSKYKKFKFDVLIYILVIINIEIMAYGLYSSYDRNYAKNFVKVNNTEERLLTQLGKNKSYEENIKSILAKDNTSFYRIAKIPHHIQNLSIYYNYPSTECFLSIGNKYVYDLNNELADNSFIATNCIKGMGDRTKITTILGTKYYIADDKNKNSVPYGYKLKEKIGEVNTYENENALSLGISYSQYMLRENYEKLNPLEKEDAITKVAVINSKEDLQGLEIEEKQDLLDIQNSAVTLPIKITDDEAIMNSHNKEKAVITSKKNQKLKLTIPKVSNSEIYVLITGFDFEGTDQHTITASFKGVSASKTIENRITSAYYEKCSQVLLPLGFYENAKGDITLSFSTKGTYKFENIQVLAVSMKNYEKTMKNLKENELKVSKCNDKEIVGTVNLKENSIMQISTSYTTGWKAYVDGKKVNTIRVNTAFVGIPLEAGEHSIELKYEVPYLKEGMVCSIVGICLFVGLAIFERRKIKA